ncbi:MAG TPA: S9 family peptidase [Prolixibacteraceae bacterium]|jgi:dipeptidyl aminopeptidase/acylaminoacyl peptidase|nr:S9 family peptidase [Bacteroidales bacterium]OQB78838.1 MAG: Prolyl tripeptidyl peptidase precursor [Bacteroidetes bacterium ADurb.Bin123]HNU77615.1 S9 family peptidase [Prolixibacteraceae bacterium]HNZ68952.1 S9 family peptidase [Prolixibacteraceae bacterium]HOC85481.1 S9 family peptidase [Prolixibacteraceae bacterium]
MKKIITVMMWFAMLAACEQAEQKTPLLPLEDFFRNPEKTAFQLSPNGEYFSYLAPWETRLNIFVQKVGADSAVRITSETARDIAGYLWKGDNRLLYLKDTGGDENYQLYGVDVDGSDLKGLTVFEKVRTEFIDDLKDVENEIIVGLNQRDPTVFDPYRLNVVTGEMTQLAENPGNIMGWMTDHEGKLRVGIASDGVNQTILYRQTEQDPFVPVLTTSFKETVNPALFTFDNTMVYALSNLGRDKSALVLFDIAKGEEKEVIFETPEADLNGVDYSRKDKKLLSVSWTTDKDKEHFFDSEANEMKTYLEGQLPGYQVAIGGNNKNEDKFIVRTYNDRSRGAYYFFDRNTKELTYLTDLTPWLKEKDLAEMKPISYTSRDGLTIHGYLTLPRGIKAEKLPVVVNPHGGPWARDYWGFNPEVQFLANNGYAVLQMNFRGSTGYGREFWEASFKQWGRTMQDDISDGVKWLIDQGIADPGRIAIYGGSYGGYATLAGLTLTPELYAAGVDYVGVSNMFTFMKTIPPYWKPMLDMLYEMVGDPQADSLMLAEVSPVLQADKIIAPLFVAQGANDPRVNKDESDQMVAALKARGIDVEYMVKDNEGHGFRNEENRFDFYRAMIAFLDKHLKPAE